jgi:signal peptidase I
LSETQDTSETRVEPRDESSPGEDGRSRGGVFSRKKKGKVSMWKEFPILLVVAFAVALLIKTFILQAFYIPSGSMIPTLMIGDRVLVEKLSYDLHPPKQGDVIVFEKKTGATAPSPDQPFYVDIENSFKELFGFPTAGNEDLIKRVIAVGGQTIEGRKGHVLVDGHRLPEPYLPKGTVTSSFGPITVPANHLFMMGDNRGNSDDSGDFGPVSADVVVGHAFVVLWPAGDFHGL